MLSVEEVRAQACPTNMLLLPEDGGYATLGDNPALRLDSAFTIEAWVRLNSTADRSTIIEKSNGGNTINYSLALGTLNTVVARVSGPTGVVSLTSGFVPNIADWHHYAVVFRPNDSLIIYVDGEFSAGIKTQARSLTTGTDILRIGSSGLTGGKNLYGAIDEVRLWKIARKQADIKADKNRVVAKNSSGLSAYLSFNDDAVNGSFFENKGLIATLVSGGMLVASSAPIEGTAASYKLKTKEAIVRLPVLKCGNRYDTVVRVRNLGLDSVNVTEMGLLRGTAFSVAGPETLILPPDSSFYGEIRIQFNPTVSGIYVDTLVIGSSSACAGQIKIPLIDTFISVGFETVQKQISIGNTLNCDLPLTKRVTLKNTGASALNITNAYFVDAIGASVVTAIPFELRVGESKEVEIRVEKGTDGYVMSELILESDACQRTASIDVTITRETIRYFAPAKVEINERVILSDKLVLDTVVRFTNTSQRSILITSASVTGVSQFEVYPQFAATALPAGETLEIPLRFTTSNCGSFNGNLRVFGTPCGIDATIRLSVGVVAPKPELPTIVDMGFSCDIKDTLLLLRNPYDSAITLTGYSFSVPGVFSTSTSFPLKIPALGYKLLDLRFKPAIEKEYEVKLSMTNARCGAISITFRGSYGTKSLAVTPSMDFGRGCDMSPVSREITFTNNSPREVTVAKALILNTIQYQFLDLELPATVPAGGSKNFKIEFRPEAGLVSKGIAYFKIAEGCRTSEAELYGSREEPKLNLSNDALEFDTVCPSLSRTLDLLLNNSGVDSIDVSHTFVAASGGFTLVNAPSALKKGLNTLQVKFSPVSNGSYLDTLVISTIGCSSVYRIALSGSGGSVPELSYSAESIVFGKVEIGKIEEKCVTVSNASCTPITLLPSSFTFSDAKYALKQTTIDQLPKKLVNGETFDICIVYRPEEHSIDVVDLEVIPAGGSSGVVRLSGQGVAPKITISDTTLDFGFVPLGDIAPRTLTIHNEGDHPATLTFSFDPPGGGFATELISLYVPEGEERVMSIEFKPLIADLYEGQLNINGADVPLHIKLRGIGSERGLVINLTELEFGNVRVNTQKHEEIKITANVFPTRLEKVAIASGPASANFSVKLDHPLPYYFYNPDDVISASVTYEPHSEEQHAAALELRSTDQMIELALTGRGIDAHIVTEDLIDFEVAELEVSTFKSFDITNTGLYPLKVRSASTELPFEVAAIDETIPPGETHSFNVGFTPASKKEVQGELHIVSDAAEGERVIRLVGKGGDLTQSVPRIAYELPVNGVSAVIGEQVTTPITIYGNKLDQFTSDSFYIEVRHDPWMLYLYGADASNSVTNGMALETGKLNDTVFYVRGWGQPFTLEAGKSLIELKGEALFGPRERTEMEIVKAYPSTLSTITQDVSVFRVTNCKDQAAGAIHKGAYAVQNAYPTPTSTSAIIEYTLGFMGGADIEIVDDMGRVVKQVTLPERPKGQHTYQLDVTDLANGHYSGLFRSREFMKRIDLIIQH
jgi:hypothetical protein